MKEKIKFIAVGILVTLVVILIIGFSVEANKRLGGSDLNRFTSGVTNTSVSCDTSSTLAVATSSDRAYVALVNDSSNAVYLGLGVPAETSKGIRLNATGGSYEITPENLFTGPIYCIAGSASTLTITYK